MYGYYVDEDLILEDGSALPDETTGTSTAVKLNPNTNGRVQIDIYANTDIAIATGSAFFAELLAGATAATCVAPITNGHTYIVHKTSADDAIAFDSGDLIASYIVPANLANYVQLGYSTDEDLSAQKIDVFARYLA